MPITPVKECAAHLVETIHPLMLFRCASQHRCAAKERAAHLAEAAKEQAAHAGEAAREYAGAAREKVRCACRCL